MPDSPVPAHGALCPCDSARPFIDCCSPWLASPERIPDAPTLMRSRYTAYVLGRLDHVRATWAPETRPDDITPDAEALRWLGLDVRAHRLVDDTHATVEFVARSKLAGRAHRLHELSRFERRDGRWYYVDGDMLC